ncbi:hypothetical protein DM01DRAFT_1333773 [Hesseltinella vesiculosa]|uniref:Non-structural maintenance of chromosomes element 4 n=1 Tax=Hesseltinella vesiculosa TaxID=101127 RepID=A0A1X2GNV8_9FUNG|nr:hypothetical protein DM01DRAFT_1333773 [Hesseltinella vesiculosa]
MSNGHRGVNGNGGHTSMRQQDENYQYMTQDFESRVDKSHYDPFQDKDERRQIRHDYRKLIKTTEDNKREYADAFGQGLDDTLAEANNLFTKVRNTTEATLDSRLLVLSADITTQKARNLRVDHQLFNVDEFIAKVKSFCSGSSPEVVAENWVKLGKRATKYGRTVRSIDFMLGPLSVEKKKRKITKQVRLTKNKEDLVQPQQLEQNDIQKQTNETTLQVNQVYKILDQRGPTNYFEFITNPDSFSQTVENMFYVSFLIRNGVAEIDDSTGQPILATRATPSIDELSSGLTKKQLIIPLTMSLWEQMKKAYGIRRSIIPMRDTQENTLQAGKWY